MKEGAPAKAQKYLSNIWTSFFFSWMLYPGAYIMPNLFCYSADPALTETAVVARNIIYTIPDVASKVIYGIFLKLAVQEMSNAEGYDYETMENAL